MNVLAKTLVLAALAASPALAGEPAALVLDVQGSVEPQVALYDEVGDGTVLKLADGARLTISHYGACEEVAVTGGTVSIGMDKLGLDQSQVQSRTAVQCPDQIVMAAADLINMAVTLRSARKVRVMAPTPEFVLPGAWGKQFDKLDVYGDGGLVATVPVAGGHATWPTGQAPLTVGGTYVVVLNGEGAQQHAARIEVTDDSPSMTVLKAR